MTLSIEFTPAATAGDAGDYAPTSFDPIFSRYGAQHSIPLSLLQAIARHESRLDASARGEINSNRSRDWGLMQVNDSEAVIMGFEPSRLLEPDYNVMVATTLLAQIRDELGVGFGTLPWIAAYNAGSPAVRARGVFNVSYVSAVLFHLVNYELAEQLRTGPA